MSLHLAGILYCDACPDPENRSFALVSINLESCGSVTLKSVPKAWRVSEYTEGNEGGAVCPECHKKDRHTIDCNVTKWKGTCNCPLLHPHLVGQ